jgi:hypothetical protein
LAFKDGSDIKVAKVISSHDGVVQQARVYWNRGQGIDDSRSTIDGSWSIIDNSPNTVVNSGSVSDESRVMFQLVVSFMIAFSYYRPLIWQFYLFNLNMNVLGATLRSI